jgi:hypothetical protein
MQDHEKQRPRRRAIYTRIAASLCLGSAAVVASGAVGHLAFRRIATAGPGVRAVRMIAQGFHLDAAGGLWTWSAYRENSARFGEAYREPSGVPAGAAPDPSPWPTTTGLASHFRQVDWLEVGWPLPCFVAVHATYADSAAIAGGKTLRGFDLDSPSAPDWLRPASGTSGWGHTILPTSIRWPFFLANIAVWSAATWCLLSLPAASRALRRRRRRKRGLCHSCGYDIKANSGPCPECGA